MQKVIFLYLEGLLEKREQAKRVKNIVRHLLYQIIKTYRYIAAANVYCR